MIVRVGLPATTGSLPAAAERLDAPVLVSANSLWDDKRKHFRRVGDAVNDLDVALDSAGFVAMSRYGGYRWTVQEYVDLAASYSWAWWASMDCCCEPEVADSHGEVMRRIRWSTMLLWRCRQLAEQRRQQGCFWLQDPLPVLQGWAPDDYERCVEMYAGVLEEWPDTVAIGSVCRREIRGPSGLAAILDRLRQVLPANVGFHLFGVKGSALRDPDLCERVVSTDSAAWDFRARIAAREDGAPYNMEWREKHMRDWYHKQFRRGDG